MLFWAVLANTFYSKVEPFSNPLTFVVERIYALNVKQPQSGDVDTCIFHVYA